MISALLAPLLALAPAAPPVARARVPADVPMSGLLELTREGEVALLPAHNQQPFNAILVTKSKDPCPKVAHDMMDIESWPSRWSIKDAVVLERTPTRVKYEIQLDIAIAPRIPGIIDHPDANRVIFNDIQTGAQFIWTLDPLGAGGGESGCAMRYSLLETPGKASGWVAVVKALETSAVDAANFAAALSSSRGFAKPEQQRGQVTQSGETAFASLAAHGTALRLVRAPKKFPVIVARRVVERSVDDVVWAIRDKRRYQEKIDVIRSVTDRGRTARYTVGAFGGRVGIATEVVESGDLRTPEGLTIRETVTGGDLDKGSWVWKIRPVPGGTDVELTWDVDVAEGSAVMRTLGRTDPVARESLAIHMALAFVGELVGGKPIGRSALAKVP
jgi:hypothetical protein